MAPQTDSVAKLRHELRDLDEERRAVEEEIALLSERLNAPGQPGMKGSLLDKQGFPRADIDVVQVRRDRQRIICLTNDHKVLTDKLAQSLAELHAAARSHGSSTADGTAASVSGSAGAALAPGAHTHEDAGSDEAVRRGGEVPTNSGAAAMEVDSQGAAASTAAGGISNGVNGAVLQPFALVDEVSPGSPADLAGLQVGDLLCAFGDVSAADAAGATGGILQSVAAELAASEGRPVVARVLRQGSPLELSLTPARWAGRGLLGCHLQPL